MGSQPTLCARASANPKRTIPKLVVRVDDDCTHQPYDLRKTISVLPQDCTVSTFRPTCALSANSLLALFSSVSASPWTIPRQSAHRASAIWTGSLLEGTYHFGFLKETKTIRVEYSLLLRVPHRLQHVTPRGADAE